MLSHWRNWCRLCANDCAVYKLESLEELNDIIMRHFNIAVQELNNMSNCICEECYNFVNKLEHFKERCIQTSKMLVELCTMDDEELLDSDVQDIRFRFLSDSIIPPAEVMQEEKPCPQAPALDVCLAAVTLDQEVDGKDLVEQELVDLKIEKMSELSKKRDASNEDRLTDKAFLEPKELLEIVLENDRLLGKLPVDEYVDLNADVPLMQGDEDNDNVEDKDFEAEPEVASESEHEVKSTRVKPRRSRKRKVRTKPLPAPISQRIHCESCDATFRTRALYIYHLQSMHPDSKELSFSCSLCPKRFSSEKKAKLHESVHLPIDQKLVHPCNYCDKRFSKLVNVQAHIKAIHIGERPYICEECGKAFGTKGALKEHQVTHSDEKPFQCSYCPKTFKNLPRLKTHEDIHNDTLYVCPHCGLQLNTKRTLKMHMVVHSDQKKFKCQYCGNEYKRSKALKNHLILHTGLRPYHCPFCDKTFANGSNCRSHKKKAHPKELAALEASGEQTRATNIPKLDQLQPKKHQSTPTSSSQVSTSNSTVVPVAEPPVSSIVQTSVLSGSTNQSQLVTATSAMATVTHTPPTAIIAAGSTQGVPASIDTATEELVLHRGIRLVTAYFHSQSEPPPLNIISTTIKTAELNERGPCQSRSFSASAAAQDSSTSVVAGEQVHLAMAADMVSLPPLHLISTNNL